MNALANPEVGKYLHDQFVSSYQKVGTFKIVNGQKQGGNVATYFCLPDGRVLHVLAGPVDAATLLREARWVVEMRKQAVMEAAGNNARYQAFIRKAHADRLEQEHGLNLNALQRVTYSPLPGLAMAPFGYKGQQASLSQQGKIHLLLATNPLVKIEKIYGLIFEKILHQKVSTLPVTERG